MIVNSQQHEQLKQEALRSLAPSLWSLLNYPFEDVQPPRMLTRQQQRRALAELHSLWPDVIPQRLILDDLPGEDPKP